VKLKKGDKVVSLASEKIYEVAEDMADNDECVKLFVLFRLGSTVQWITTTAPTNGFIKVK
jgi:hypothetical protein